MHCSGTIVIDMKFHRKTIQPIRGSHKLMCLRKQDNGFFQQLSLSMEDYVAQPMQKGLEFHTRNL